MAGAYRDANATVSAHGAVAVVPSDATVFPVCRALYVGSSGNITLRTPDGQTVLFSNVAAGIFPVQCDMVMSTGTAASLMVALY